MFGCRVRKRLLGDKKGGLITGAGYLAKFLKVTAKLGRLGQNLIKVVPNKMKGVAKFVLK